MAHLPFSSVRLVFRSWLILLPPHFTCTVWSPGWTHIHANWWKMNPTIRTETRPNSQFGHYFPSANHLFNRFVFVSHANVSNSESVTQIFPVNWWLIGVVSGQVYANIDLNHVTTLSILRSFSCPERRKFNLIICFLMKLSAGHLPHENTSQEPAHDSYHICHLRMSVRRQSMNYVQTKCVAHYSHTWVRDVTGDVIVMTSDTWWQIELLWKRNRRSKKKNTWEDVSVIQDGVSL